MQAVPGASAYVATLNAWNLDADVNSPEAGMSLLLYTFYVDGLAKAEQYGLTIAVPDRLPRPEQLDPALAQSSPQRFFGNEMAFHYALSEAARYYPLLLDPLLPGVTSPVTPWTPTPWAGLSTQLTVAGHIKYLDLTPSRNPLEFAIWPVGGTADNLWTLVTNDFKKPSDAFFTQFGLLGQVGPFMTLPVDTGSHTMLQIELGSPPQAFFLEAIGPTERVDNPARYVNAADFAAGNYKPFPCDQSTVFAESTQVDVLSFAPTTDGSAGAGGTGGSDGGL
ncbi:MAG: hypothetical protein R3F20_17060 [Planctomycetota bacterium]